MTFSNWAVVELMGHVRLAGLVTEEELFGSKLGRIDIPTGATEFVTQYFGGNSVYRVTPCAEDIARKIAAESQQRPISQWEIRDLVPKITVRNEDFDDIESDEDE